MQVRLKLSDIGLKKGYKWLISNLNYEIYSGEALCLSGANGIGKTTLLRTLAGFFTPETGRVELEIDGTILSGDTIVANYSHYLGHQEALSPSRRVEQELRFQCDYMGGDAQGLARAVARLGLSGLMDLETRLLSAGQRRRLSCARLLMVERPVWLLDEPMAPLDVEHRALLAELMQAHLAGGGVMVCAVHDPLPFVTRELVLRRPEVGEVAYG